MLRKWYYKHILGTLPVVLHLAHNALDAFVLQSAGPFVEMTVGEDRDDILLVVLVFLLLMLSVVIWVAFCIAVRKTARKFLELKRQRRREALINAAITRAAQGEETARRTGLPLYIATVTQGLHMYDRHAEELPSYEQALSMSATPSPNPRPTERAPPYKPPPKRNDHGVRVAPDRPGSVTNIVLPPSYDSCQSTSTQVFTVSQNVAQTPL